MSTTPLRGGSNRFAAVTFFGYHSSPKARMVTICKGFGYHPGKIARMVTKIRNQIDRDAFWIRAITSTGSGTFVNDSAAMLEWLCKSANVIVISAKQRETTFE